MRRRLFVSIILLACVLPMLACAALWSATANPGTARTFVLPLVSGQEFHLYVRPCNARRSGYVVLRYANNWRQNRFVNGELHHIIGMPTTAPCP